MENINFAYLILIAGGKVWRVQTNVVLSMIRQSNNKTKGKKGREAHVRLLFSYCSWSIASSLRNTWVVTLTQVLLQGGSKQFAAFCKTYIVMSHYDHSLSVEATTMVLSRACNKLLEISQKNTRNFSKRCSKKSPKLLFATKVAQKLLKKSKNFFLFLSSFIWS